MRVLPTNPFGSSRIFKTRVIRLRVITRVNRLRVIKFLLMRFKFVDEIRGLIQESKNWVELEIEYAKLTLAEKLTMLLSTLIIGFVCLLLGTVVIIMLAFALTEVWKMIMSPALAYLATGGVLCLLVFLSLSPPQAAPSQPHREDAHKDPPRQQECLTLNFHKR